MKDGVGTHAISASLAGIVAVICGSPVDVLKTRMMNAPKGMYANPIDAVMQTLTKEGPLAFYKGFGPNCLRLGAWNTVMFMTLEQVRKLMN